MLHVLTRYCPLFSDMRKKPFPINQARLSLLFTASLLQCTSSHCTDATSMYSYSPLLCGCYVYSGTATTLDGLKSDYVYTKCMQFM